MSSNPQRAVLTIATGNPLYLQMAVNLARSFMLWHRRSDIRFFIATDSSLPLPADLQGIGRINFKSGEYGKGFTTKLYLDRLAPAKETLFVDSDCLCAGNLEPIFEKFSKCEAAVIGREETEGDFFGDIATRCRLTGAKWVPRFCGGIYYLKKGAVSEKVFSTARQLEARYDELGMIRLRGLPNEEPLVGLAMAMAEQHPIPEDGSIKAEPMFFSGPAELDVFRGRARLSNLPGKSPCGAWADEGINLMPDTAAPAIMHFNCTYGERPPYTTEAFRLEKVLRYGWPLPVASFYAWLAISLPYRAKTRLKNLARPVFHFFFSHRAVKRSARI